MARKKKPKEKIVYKIRYYDRTEPKPTENFLKYWRCVRYWVLKNYDISVPDLDMLLFIYDERLFTVEDFEVFSSIQPWDKKRFYRLKKQGWIRCWKTRKERKGKAGLYEISYKGRELCRSVYRKLNGEEDFSISPARNSVFKGNGYTDGRYVRQMIEINRQNRERRLRALAESPSQDPPQSR